MRKGLTQQEGKIFVNNYVANIEAPKYTKQILTGIQGKINSNIIKENDFNTSLASMDR